MKKSVWLLIIGAALIVGAYFLKQYETRQELEEDPEEIETEEAEIEPEEPVKTENNEKETAGSAGE